eukprot:scaffold34601_cov234-Amphora_coffeaeformis.AAC.16
MKDATSVLLSSGDCLKSGAVYVRPICANSIYCTTFGQAFYRCDTETHPRKESQVVGRSSTSFIVVSLNAPQFALWTRWLTRPIRIVGLEGKKRQDYMHNNEITMDPLGPVRPTRLRFGICFSRAGGSPRSAETKLLSDAVSKLGYNSAV